MQWKTTDLKAGKAFGRCIVTEQHEMCTCINSSVALAPVVQRVDYFIQQIKCISWITLSTLWTWACLVNEVGMRMIYYSVSDTGKLV